MKMIGYINSVFMRIAVYILIIKTCTSEPQTPYLALYSPGDTEYTEVLVRRTQDNLTLVCEVRGEAVPKVYVWNYVSNNITEGDKPLTIEPIGMTLSSKLQKTNLQLSDSGLYICSAPPFSSTKYVLVQPREAGACARGAFRCGARCVLPAYVCDGRRDCVRAEDEAPPLCAPQPCARSDRLNCSTGRCVPEAACCREADPLCRQPSCCDEHARFSTREGFVEVEYPPLFEDRHAPDEYGFIQSTIYTVTACALIFMIAVVLLVSALCKMHMKRAALRGYATAHRDTAHHYAARYPPRYEVARLLEPGASSSPVRSTQVASEVTSPSSAEEPPRYGSGFGFSSLSDIFCSRYRQVPTQCCDVEMTDVRTTSPPDSPRGEPPPPHYTSPTLCHSDLYFAEPELSPRELNYMATPVDFFRRRTCRRNTIDRVMEQLGRAPRPLTLQLGRFQLSIPRPRRDQPRPDTPNVADAELDDTYTLNGRTVRLLGAHFDSCPAPLARPPPYSEAVRHKCGPPPHYLSRERVDGDGGHDSENEARSNVEMPPCYEDLTAGVDANANVAGETLGVVDATNNNVAAGRTVACDDADRTATDDVDAGSDIVVSNSRNDFANDNALFVGNDNVPETISSVIDNLPAIDSDVNANEPLYNGNAITAQE